MDLGSRALTGETGHRGGLRHRPFRDPHSELRIWMFHIRAQDGRNGDCRQTRGGLYGLYESIFEGFTVQLNARVPGRKNAELILECPRPAFPFRVPVYSWLCILGEQRNTRNTRRRQTIMS